MTWQQRMRGVGAALAAVVMALGVSGVVFVGGPGDTLAQAVSGRALVWQVGGSPGQPAGLGTLFWHEAGQEPVNLSDVPDEGRGTRVFACGMDAVSRDGDYLIAYIGAQSGGLYRVPLSGDSGIERWGDAHALACNGRGHAAFSPDGARWAYLNFEADAVTSPFPDGTLRILNTDDGSEVARFDSVVTFALHDDGAYFAQFFTDARGLADEAAVNRWDGSAMREILTLTPDTDCSWTSARLTARPDGEEVALSLGQSCRGGSVWRLLTLTSEGETTERVLAPAGGVYYPASYTNQVAYLEDSAYLLATDPNGRLRNLANLFLLTLETNDVTLVRDQVVVDEFPDGRAEHVLFAPGGSSVAFRTDTANGEQTLHLLPLNGSTETADIPAGSGGDVFLTFFFTPDGRQLIFVAGARDGGDNALWTLNVGDKDPRRVVRGHFMAGGGLAGDGVALVLEYVPPDDDHRDAAANLVAISLEDGSRTLLVDGREAAAWAYPLAWR